MLKIIPDVVSNQRIHALGAGDAAHAAARMMVQFDISAVLVMEPAGALLGVVTERDLARRVVAESRDPAQTPLSAIMTPDPDTISADASPLQALEKMRLKGYRHLPVVREGEVVGVISMRDLRHTIARSMKSAPRPRPLLRAWRRMVGSG